MNPTAEEAAAFAAAVFEGLGQPRKERGSLRRALAAIPEHQREYAWPQVGRGLDIRCPGCGRRYAHPTHRSLPSEPVRVRLINSRCPRPECDDHHYIAATCEGWLVVTPQMLAAANYKPFMPCPISDWTRRRMREDGFYSRIVPPIRDEDLFRREVIGEWAGSNSVPPEPILLPLDGTYLRPDRSPIDRSDT